VGQTGCSTAINVASDGVRGLRGAKSAINLERNFVYLAAARSNEAAYDDSQTGGVASTALIDCLSDPATDTDHSGSVSFGELIGCAQKRVDTRESKDERLRQHLVLAGNDGMPVASAPQPADARMNPKATLRDLLSAADARWSVQAVPSAQRLKIKQDAFSVRVTTNTSGFLYVFYVGSDNQEFLKLYPTTASESNAIAAGVPFAIPRVWRSEGPPGDDHLLVVVTPEQRDLGKVFGLQLSAPATYQSSNELQDAFRVCRNLSEQPCTQGGSRNLSATDSVTSSNSALYGAALLIIEETTQ
jgi:hypothetical protein